MPHLCLGGCLGRGGGTGASRSPRPGSHRESLWGQTWEGPYGGHKHSPILSSWKGLHALKLGMGGMEERSLWGGGGGGGTEKNVGMENRGD